jgi:hypothetical protein
MLPDERAFRADVDAPSFRLGTVDGRWRLISTDWPYALIAVTAADSREYVLRFNCSGFPATPPTAGPWDPDRKAPLAPHLWPRSRRGRIGAVFRQDWKGGSALYLPCDREAIPGHENWRTQMPSKIWRPDIGIVHYLELVHDLLNSPDYEGPLGSAA